MTKPSAALIAMLALVLPLGLVGPPADAASGRKPLAGRVIVIDPGHHLGNSHHPRQIHRLVYAGFGLYKACNTTGTSTNGGYAEASFTLAVARRLASQLRSQGATVILTRKSNNTKYWGPCVDVRGQIGNKGYRKLKRAADLKISIHADGSSAGNHGFHLIVAKKKQSRAGSDRFARAIRAELGRAKFSRSNYIGTTSRGVVHRGDLGTLNWSHIPTVMIEAGNMRNAADARTLVAAKGQKRYATALDRAIGDYFRR